MQDFNFKIQCFTNMCAPAFKFFILRKMITATDTFRQTEAVLLQHDAHRRNRKPITVQLSMCQLSNDIMANLSDCSRDNCVINYWQWTVIDSLKQLHAANPVVHTKRLTDFARACVCREDFHTVWPHFPIVFLSRQHFLTPPTHYQGDYSGKEKSHNAR